MRPDAAMFLPRNKTPSPSNGDLTLIPYNSSITNKKDNEEIDETIRKNLRGLLNFVSVKKQDAKETPHEMIVHESIKGLLDEVTQLRARCDGLESVNAELKSEMSILKDYYAADHAPASTNGNLTGYASSSTISDDGTQGNGAHATLATKMAKLEVDMLERFKAVGELFESLQQHVSTAIANRKAETATLDCLQEEIEEMKRDSNAVEGRVHSLETKLKSDSDGYGLDRLDETGDTYYTDPRSTTSTAEMTSYFTDELEQVQTRLNMSTIKCESFCHKLSEKVEALRAAVEGGVTQGPESNLPSYAAENKVPKASKQDVVDLKNWQHHMLRQAANNQRIDDAHTREILYAMFFQLSHIMEKGDGPAIWCEGSLEATSDEAFQLRDRVLCRLALFDRYGAALEEVQARRGRVDW